LGNFIEKRFCRASNTCSTNFFLKLIIGKNTGGEKTILVGGGFGGGERVFTFTGGVDQTVFSYSQQLTTHLQKLFKRSCVPELDRLVS
jgi:hypothetical protein